MIISEEKGFRPIVITLETKKEAEMLKRHFQFLSVDEIIIDKCKERNYKEATAQERRHFSNRMLDLISDLLKQ